MARITVMPSEEVIGALKGVLDFYFWKGIPCVRKWPHTPMSSRTQASLDSAQLFGQIARGWALVGGVVKDQYTELAAGTPRTGRDVYMAGVLGHLHERS